MDNPGTVRREHGILTGMHLPDGPEDLGLVTTTTALCPRADGGLGLTERALHWRVDSGRWQRLHTGVYVTRPGRVDWLTRAGAALLAYGDDAALCGPSAGFLHELIADPGEQIHILVPAAARPRHHVGTVLHRSDRRRVLTTWPARTAYETTVVDLAASPRADDLVALLAGALRTRRTTVPRLRDALGALRTHPRRRLLGDLLGAVEDGSEGALEVRFVRDVLRRHGLPTGVAQLPAHALASGPLPTTAPGSVTGPSPADRRRFDRAIVAQRLLFELDGTLYHQGSRRVADRRKSNLAARHDWLLLRYGWVETVDEACASAAEVTEVLIERGWSGMPRRCSPRCPVPVVAGRRAG